jgi:hypothetical protein
LKDHRALDSSCQLDTRPRPAKNPLATAPIADGVDAQRCWRLAIPLGRRYF